MSGLTVTDFLGYWEREGANYVQHGDYAWMAGLVPGRRVLEVGCGVGYATAALLARGLPVLALDTLPECLAATASRISQEHASADLRFLQGNITALGETERAAITAFNPDSVVCWLMGAPAETTGASAHDNGEAVAAYREKIHRAVAELAAGLPGVRWLHFVDRTAIPWQAKDIGRDTLVRYHRDKTLLDLPFVAERRSALYRKLGDNLIELAQLRQAHPALKSVVPTLASLLAERKQSSC